MLTSPDMVVSAAADEDLPFISQDGRDMFARSHLGAMRPDDLASYVDVAFDVDRLRRHLRRPDNDFLIVRVDGKPTGYARLVDGAPSALVNQDPVIELRRMYVLDAWHGTGAASSLMSGVLSVARAREKSACWLHVWERNARAIRFYEKCGFSSVGREAAPYRDSSPIVLVMVRTLD